MLQLAKMFKHIYLCLQNWVLSPIDFANGIVLFYIHFAPYLCCLCAVCSKKFFYWQLPHHQIFKSKTLYFGQTFRKISILCRILTVTPSPIHNKFCTAPLIAYSVLYNRYYIEAATETPKLKYVYI